MFCLYVMQIWMNGVVTFLNQLIFAVKYFFIFLCDKHYEKKRSRFRKLIPNPSIVFEIFYFIASMALSLYEFLQ